VILAAVMPGCEKLELVDGQYVGEIKVKVGPIQGKFTGKVDLKDKEEPRSYTMIVDGRGAPGFVKATAAVKLAPEGDATRVTYDTDAHIGGKIASVGQRLIEASARAIVAQSLEGLHTNIKLRAAAHREAAAKLAASVPAAAASESTTAPTPAVSASESTAAPAPAASASESTTAPAPAPSPAESAPAPSAAESAPPASARESTTTSAPATSVEPGRTVDAGKAIEPGKAADPPVVAFTPVKVKQSDLANAVAKEVASSLFPRSVLVAIILIEALVIVWLLLRH
jgi:carbon monoxide dehydrogenase subunit G